MTRTQEITRADGTIVRRKPREGDLRWDGVEWNRWSGRGWRIAAYSLDPGRLRRPARIDLDQPIAVERRRRLLDRAVEDQVATKGATVVFDGPEGVVLGYRRRPAHVRHALMTFLTMGLWVPVWIVAAVIRREDRARFIVDDWGNVWAKPVAGA